MAAKILSVSTGLFRGIYNVALVALFFWVIEAEDIEAYFLGTTLLLMVTAIALALVFKESTL